MLHLTKDKTGLFRFLGWIAVLVAAAVTLSLATVGLFRIFAPPGEYVAVGTDTFTRTTTAEEEDYDDTYTICRVEYENADGVILAVGYTYEEWEELPEGDTRIGWLYRTDGGTLLALPEEATDASIRTAYRDIMADEAADLFGAALAVGLFTLGLLVIVLFGKHFTLYEKCWFLGILVLASVFSLIFPEEDCNGINGLVIMGLYLLDTFLNILCELLISKQSKWNFIVSVFVELTEILICVVLAYRFATMATTLLFWLPCDIISFINWNRKPDHEDEELTRVRTLKGWQEVLILAGIVVWTLGVGYLLTLIDFGTDLFHGNEVLKIVVCYLDACASAVGVANGLAILFRFREQWIAWYICAVLEAVINILSGQYVLLVLKAGYITNTTYGYIQWTKYIKKHPEAVQEKSFF